MICYTAVPGLIPPGQEAWAGEIDIEQSDTVEGKSQPNPVCIRLAYLVVVSEREICRGSRGQRNKGTDQGIVDG